MAISIYDVGVPDNLEGIFVYQEDGTRRFIPCDRKKTIAEILKEARRDASLVLVPDGPPQRMDTVVLVDHLSKRDRVIGRIEQELLRAWEKLHPGGSDEMRIPTGIGEELLEAIANLYGDKDV